MSGADFLSPNYAGLRVGERGNTQQNRVRTCAKRSRVRQSSPAYSDAEPDRLRPTVAAAAADDFLYLERINPNVTDNKTPRT